MTRRLVLATRNAHKVDELHRIIGECGMGIELVGLDALPNVQEVAETGATFAENALLKAHAVSAATGLSAIADDSGLCVEVLGGMPGIFSARWAGRHGDDEANLDLVLEQLAEIPDDRRSAAFVCAAALALPDGCEHVVEGRLPGQLIRKRRGGNGFGYDPIFIPDGEIRTTAEMSASEKDAISHRGRAFRSLAAQLPSLLSEPPSTASAR